MSKWYLNIGNASHISDPWDRFIYRALEIFPGLFAWITLGGMVFFSWQKPVWVAIFIITFDTYWLIKTTFFSIHLIAAYSRMKRNLKINWRERLEQIPSWRQIYHLIIYPMYKEGPEVVRTSFQNLVNSDYPLGKMIVVLATEERAGKVAQDTAQSIKKEFGNKFYRFLVTRHPSNIPGEIAGKGANDTWAAKEAKKKIIDPLKIPYENIIVSAFDIDTSVFPQYFASLTYHYLRAKKPLQSSYQPIAMFHNNFWDAPCFARVTAGSTTFWEMMQQQRPEKLATFSSHSMSFKTLVDIGFWQTNMVNEDSRIFWQCFLHYNGDYRVIPLHFPVSMDACLGDSLWRTAINQYRQKRRWGYGVENAPYIIFGFLKNKKIALKEKLLRTFLIIEGYHAWATNAFIILLLGWLPLALGGPEFNITVISYNLPYITKILMTCAMIGLVASAAISTLLLPPRPPRYKRYRNVFMVLQWFLLPLTIIFFGAIPGLDAQTRLMFGKYMGFWVTEKKRRSPSSSS